YIEEAEEMADRIGIINKGRLILAEDKTTLMKKLGQKRLTLTLEQPIGEVPPALAAWPLEIKNEGMELEFRFDIEDEQRSVAVLLERVVELGIGFKDLSTRQSSLEEIFVSLVSERTEAQV